MKKLITVFIIIGLVSSSQAQMKKSLGGMMGTRGFGIVFSGQWQIKSDLEVGFETRYYDIKNDSELPIYNQYTGQSYNVGDKALFMIPFFGTVTWFPFEGKIANNFSPFVTLKLGPVLAIDGQEEYRKFTKRWGQASTSTSFGSQIVIGVAFRQRGGGIISPSIGFEFLPMGKEIDGRRNYDGTAINITWIIGNSRR
ncbi:MAG: hypothetical protein QF743_06295 [Candidatus Marinimicrobia bacterium]|jgi:hypothetical protein|nr:hypothetical protein [Candidatus Neomarinimicrobiota bacterium]MDP6612054.1 hypothetical protein [Candidatus Neomarinimicrobiota bacterium]|tara:strand:- start:1509 stop:2099 length:591 start_codon:yes stop_codon:yes gene_type:complete